MTRTEFASISINKGDLSDTTLTKGLFICLLHVKRVPPHTVSYTHLTLPTNREV